MPRGISVLPTHSLRALPRGPCVHGGSGERGRGRQQVVAGSGLCQAHLPLRRQKGSSGAGTRMVLKMGW